MASKELMMELKEEQFREKPTPSALGGLMTWNAEYGFLEGLLRGLRSGFLSSYEYKALKQCESVDMVKLALSDTDLSDILKDHGGAAIDSQLLAEKMMNKFIQEFRFIHTQAVGQLSTFLDYVTYEYQIQGILLLVSGMMSGSDPSRLLAKVHPLGRSPHLRMVLTFNKDERIRDAATGQEISPLMHLYKTVLIDTDVGKYFTKYFEDVIMQGGQAIQNVFNEVDIYLIKAAIENLWLEDFYRYTQRLGGETASAMKEVLEFEADVRAINVVLNSWGQAINEQNARDDRRKALFCSFGRLYPNCTHPPARHLRQGGPRTFSDVGDNDEQVHIAQLGEALLPYKEYHGYFKASREGGNHEGKPFVDVLTEAGVDKYKRAFEGQSHFAAFFAWTRLKHREQENVKWIVDMITSQRTWQVDPKAFDKVIHIW